MSEDRDFSEKMKAMVGQQLGQTMVLAVERGHVVKFAQATDDPNPLWTDAGYARTMGYADIVAPPTFIFAFRPEGFSEAFGNLGAPLLKRTLALGVEQEYLGSIAPGDTITVRCKLVEARERDGKSGKSWILVSEKTFVNQDGKMVARERSTIQRK